MSEPDSSADRPASPPVPVRPSHRGRWTAIIGAVAVAVLGATAAAVITPERIDTLFGLWAPAASPSATPLDSTAPTQSVATQAGSLTLEIPEDWSSRESRWNVSEDAGAGLLVGTQVKSVIDFRNDGAWIGVSSEITRSSDVAAMSPAARSDWLDSFVDVDWSREGCIPVRSEVPARAGWQLATRSWKECNSTQGQRMLEFAALSDELDLLVMGQISLTDETGDDVFELIVQSFVVSPDKLPTTTTGSSVVP